MMSEQAVTSLLVSCALLRAAAPPISDDDREADGHWALTVSAASFSA
jgi:hypothetical protein